MRTSGSEYYILNVHKSLTRTHRRDIFYTNKKHCTRKKHNVQKPTRGKLEEEEYRSSVYIHCGGVVVGDMPTLVEKIVRLI